MTAETRRRAVKAARGETPFDLLLTHTRVVDMATGEIRDADVGIVGSLIASVHPRGSRNDALETHDLNNQFLSPGLMDTHVHLESSHLLPARYAEIVLAQGTTAVFWIRTNWQTCWGLRASALPLRRAATCHCR